MRKRKELTQAEMADYADWYFKKYFKTATEAAEYFETNSPTVSQVRNGKQPPNELMLKAFEYSRADVYKRAK